MALTPSITTHRETVATASSEATATTHPTQTSKMLLPTDDETAISPKPFLATMTLVMRSGTEVPAARIVRPTTWGQRSGQVTEMRPPEELLPPPGDKFQDRSGQVTEVPTARVVSNTTMGGGMGQVRSGQVRLVHAPTVVSEVTLWSVVTMCRRITTWYCFPCPQRNPAASDYHQ